MIIGNNILLLITKCCIGPFTNEMSGLMTILLHVINLPEQELMLEYNTLKYELSDNLII